VFLRPTVFLRRQASCLLSLCESLRVSRKRVLQRRVLHLGSEHTQLERLAAPIEVIEEEEASPDALFTDGTGNGGRPAPRMCRVLLSSLVVRRARSLSVLVDASYGKSRLGEFWQKTLG